MLNTFLSIDIDYWNNDRYDNECPVEKTEKALVAIFEKAKDLSIPMRAFMNHHQIERFVSASPARRLINIDQHTDLCTPWCSEFNCGTWVSYVRWRKQGEYIWIHRHPRDWGECSQDYPIFTKKGINYNNTDWKAIRSKMGPIYFEPNRLLHDVCEIAFILSPAYCDNQLEPLFRELVDWYNIPYKRGYRAEDIRARVRKVPFRGKEYAWKEEF